MENYKQIAKEAGVSIESVRELMARACVKRVETPYYRTTEDGRKVDAVELFEVIAQLRQIIHVTDMNIERWV